MHLAAAVAVVAVIVALLVVMVGCHAQIFPSGLRWMGALQVILLALVVLVALMALGMILFLAVVAAAVLVLQVPLAQAVAKEAAVDQMAGMVRLVAAVVPQAQAAHWQLSQFGGLLASLAARRQLLAAAAVECLVLVQMR